MQHQRGPKPRGDRRASVSNESTEERATAKWPVGSHLLHSARWGDEDGIGADENEKTDARARLPSLSWTDEEDITARRSVSHLPLRSAPSWETIDVDELIPSIPPPRLSAPSVAPATNVTSVGPVAMEAGGDADEEIDFRRGTFPTRGLLFAGALVAAASFAFVVHTRGHARSAARASASPPVAAVTASPPPPRVDESLIPPPPPPAEAEPTPSVEPPKDTGTIVGSPGHRLYIDGRQSAGWKVEVKCGKHTVRNGSRSPVRTVDVPCGGDVSIAP